VDAKPWFPIDLDLFIPVAASYQSLALLDSILFTHQFLLAYNKIMLTEQLRMAIPWGNDIHPN
jgi:hypothetical protein